MYKIFVGWVEGMVDLEILTAGRDISTHENVA